MKYKDIGIIIPYEDTEGERVMTRFRFYGECDRRKMRKLIRTFLSTLGIIVSNQLLDQYIKHRQYDLYYTKA